MMGKTMAIEQLQQGKTVGYCKSMDELDTVSAKTIAIAAKNGDPTAIKVYDLCGEMLGRGLAILIDVLNPEKIVIGSIFQRDAELVRGSMEKVLKEECLAFSLAACKVVPAELGDDIGDRAALSLAISIDK